MLPALRLDRDPDPRGTRRRWLQAPRFEFFASIAFLLDLGGLAGAKDHLRATSRAIEAEGENLFSMPVHRKFGCDGMAPLVVLAAEPSDKAPIWT